MRALFLVFLLMGCVRNFSFETMEFCPAHMTEEQERSGYIRCRALCSSYGRDVYKFDEECKCRCLPANGARSPSFVPAPKPPQTNQT